MNYIQAVLTLNPVSSQMARALKKATKLPSPTAPASTCAAKPEELYPHTDFKQNCAKMF